VRVAGAAWVQGLLSLVKAVRHPGRRHRPAGLLRAQPARRVARADVINRFEQERKPCVISEGRWTPDFPILVVNAKGLGLPVSTDMPGTVYDLMDLYPQGATGRPSVLCVPVRRGVGGSNLIPSLPGLMP
jgi:serine dehydrogenase proteinase